jgi:serine/threonine-protein kinase HipA
MRLDALRRVEVADVWKAGVHAAHLERGPSGVRFSYVEGYAGPAVATTLPLAGAPVETAAGAVPPFFAGLLPEGRRLTALRTALKTSADDELSLLLAVGSDAIGDVQVVPAGAVPEAAPDITPGDGPLDFRRLFERAVARDPEDRVALPGVQDKLSGRMLALPVIWAGAPCILKLDPPEFPHLVDNEATLYRAAQRAGLSTAEVVRVEDARGQAGLLVRRFDRVGAGDGRWSRRAQEDGCQVLGRYPADKYRLSSGAVLTGLAQVCGAPKVAARTFIQQLVFAYLSCNGDAHAKNFSILQDGSGEWHPSPAYDLPCSYVYGDTSMALTIGGRSREDIGRAQFLALGGALGLPERAVGRVLDQQVAAVIDWLPLLEALPFDGRRLHKLRKAIAWRVDRLGRR